MIQTGRDSGPGSLIIILFNLIFCRVLILICECASPRSFYSSTKNNSTLSIVFDIYDNKCHKTERSKKLYTNKVLSYLLE